MKKESPSPYATKTKFLLSIISLFFICIWNTSFAQHESQGKVLNYDLSNIAIAKETIVKTNSIDFSNQGISLKKGHKEGSFVSQQFDIPLKNIKPFFTFSCRLSGSGFYEKGISFRVRFSKDNETWTEWTNINHSEDVAYSTTEFVSELYFFEDNLKYFQFSATFNDISHPIVFNAIMLNFFSPGKSNALSEEPSSMQTNKPTSCPCPQPSYISRAAWGAVAASCNPTYTTVTHIIIHHQGQQTSPINPPYDAVVRSIQNYHMTTNGWCDIAYNWLVAPNGQLYEGRGGGNNVLGAHFSSMNGGTMGVCILDNYDNITPSAAAISTLEKIIAWKCCDAGIAPIGTAFHSASGLTLNRISGHRDGNSSSLGCSSGTTCPGNNLYSLFSTIRTDVQNYMNACGGTCPQPSNDGCNGSFNATSLNFGTTCNPVSSTSCGATSSGFSACSGTADDDVFFKFTIPTGVTSATITVASSSGYDAVFQLLSGTCGPNMQSVSPGCINNSGTGGTETHSYTGLIAGATYFIRVWHAGTGSGTGTFTICAYNTTTTCPQPTNDGCSGSFNATSLNFGTTCNPTSSTSCGATSSGFSACSGTADDDVFFKFTVPTGVTTATITIVSSSGYDAVFQLLSGTCGPNMQSVSPGCINNTGTGGTETNSYTGLIAGATYFIRVWHAGTGSGSGTFAICVYSNTVTCSQPSTQASAINFSSVGTNSMTINLTSGNGTGRIIVGKAGGSITGSPVNGITYTGNAVFGSGSTLASGEYIVYSGAGSGPINVSNLNASTNYCFRIFEYNCSGSNIIYQNSTAANNPNCQATTGNGALNCSTATTISCGQTVNGTTVGGNANVSTYDCTPWNESGPEKVYQITITDPADITATISNFGSADLDIFILSSCSPSACVAHADQSATLSMTSPGTYYIVVDGYDAASGSFTLTVSCLSNCMAPATQANTLNFSSVSLNSMSLGWNNGNGTGRMVVAKAGGSVTGSPVNGITYTGNTTFGNGSNLAPGEYVVYSGTGSGPINISNLNAGTNYCFRVFEYNCSGSGIVYTNATAGSNPNCQSTIPNCTTVVPAVAISASPSTTICPGQTVTFIASPTNGGNSPTYTWYVGSNSYPGSATYTTHPLSSNTQVYCVMVSSSPCASPATATSAVTNVVVSSLTPAVSISPSTSTTICPGQTITFTATPTNGGSSPVYIWHVGTNSYAGPATFTTQALSSNTQVYCVMASNSPCASPATATSAVTNVTVSTLTPTVSISPSPSSTICPGQAVTFTATPTNGGSSPTYIWHLGVNSYLGSATFTTMPLYSNALVYCEMASNSPCANPTHVSSAVTNVVVADPVIPAITISQTSCNAGTAHFTSVVQNAGNAPSYIWTINGSGNYTDFTSPDFTVSNVSAGTVVKCTLSSNALCTGTTTVSSNEVTVNCNDINGIDIDGLEYIYITPNPNNGQFAVKMKLSLIKDVMFKLFNTAGQPVYSSATMQINGEQTIPVSKQLATGIYYLKVFIGFETITLKVVVVH